MKQIAVTAAGLGVSRLGFGCAPVMGKVGRRQALDAMACAFDLGVTHFDVARSYGFGDAEAVLGRFIRGRRDHVTVTTKFGVVPPQLSLWQRAARPIVRPLLRALAPFRARVHRASAGLLEARRFDVAYARECLAASLRQLGTDHVDFYLLHEPELDSLHGAPELQRFLDESVAAGRVRAWGFAHPVRALAGEIGGQILQFEAPANRPGLWMPAPDDPRFRFVTRPLAGGAMHDDARHAALGARLGLDRLHLAMALADAAAGERGAIIAGMFDRAHIAQNVRAVAHCEQNRATIRHGLTEARRTMAGAEARSAG
ncbi:MAG: aldo/keto reductase [Rhizobiales bacterium]|nr:aldo/keto reductase [Rhizobacter sp.]